MPSNRFRRTPMANSPIILSKLRTRNGLLELKDKGTAIPMINRNDGKMKSASVSPFHSGCSSHHGPSIKSSTISIPTIVSPRRTSSDNSLCFGCGLIVMVDSRCSFKGSVKNTSDCSVSRLPRSFISTILRFMINQDMIILYFKLLN